MISHSLIVCALITFSLAIHAGAAAIDGMSMDAGTPAVAQSAILHKDVGLHQGGGKGREVLEAPLTASGCTAEESCSTAAAKSAAPDAKTLQVLFVLSSGSSHGGVLLVLLLVGAGLLYACVRSPSTK